MQIKNIVVGYLGTNCYLLINKNKEVIIIDPGAEANKIEKALKGIHPKYIILTHAHTDHFGAVKDLKQKYNLTIAVHSFDAEMLKIFTNLRIDLLLEEKNKISLGNISLSVIHTPGHSKGSICLFDGNKNLFTGDTLFADTCGRTDLLTGSDKDMNESLKKLFALDPKIKIYPGHGPSTLLKDAMKYFSQ